MRTLVYVLFSILVALAATVSYGFVCGALGVFFPSIRNIGGGAIVFYSALALGLIYSRVRLKLAVGVKADGDHKE